MVRANVVNKSAKGGQANVDVVASSRKITDLDRVARECVTSYLKEQKAAFCKVWGQQSDYQARDLRHAGESNCWIYYVGVPLVGGDPYVTESSAIDYGISHCPGKVYAPVN